VRHAGRIDFRAELGGHDGAKEQGAEE
jgi:hypothetical protein